MKKSISPKTIESSLSFTRQCKIRYGIGGNKRRFGKPENRRAGLGIGHAARV
jgi:hypothetical protein